MEPRLGGPVSGDGVPPVDYLSWYIPRLQENRPHDLSQSGFELPTGLIADLTLCTLLSLFVNVPSFSAKLAAGKTTSAI